MQKYSRCLYSARLRWCRERLITSHTIVINNEPSSSEVLLETSHLKGSGFIFTMNPRFPLPFSNRARQSAPLLVLVCLPNCNTEWSTYDPIMSVSAATTTRSAQTYRTRQPWMSSIWRQTILSRDWMGCCFVVLQGNGMGMTIEHG